MQNFPLRKKPCTEIPPPPRYDVAIQKHQKKETFVKLINIFFARCPLILVKGFGMEAHWDLTLGHLCDSSHEVNNE